MNAVTQGVATSVLRHATATGAYRAQTLAMQAFKRMGTPHDIAEAVVFLATDGARWITRSTLRVDGGSML